MSQSELVRELQELITALDRRVPHVERAGEADIAEDAARLRATAVRRLTELTGTTADRDNPDLDVRPGSPKI